MFDAIHIASMLYLEVLRNLGIFVVLPLLVTTVIWQKLKIKPTSRIVYSILSWVTLWITWNLSSWASGSG